MFSKYNLLSTLYYISMSITHYKQTMILPLWKLEQKGKISFYNVHHNRIQDRYWLFVKLYRDIILWR